ncbi:MAG: diguanylate cyclase [Thiohalorhabdaceae bacterium]
MSEFPVDSSEVAAEIPPFLESVRSLAVAVLDRQGQVLAANQGFRDLASAPGTGDSPDAGAAFINPTLAELLARAGDTGPDGRVYEGPMTLGDVDSRSETWLGGMYLRNEHLLLVCELDVDKARKLQSQLLELTEEYAEKERELARANRELARYAEEWERIGLSDSLTGLPNRRAFQEFLEHHVAAAERFGEPLAMLVLDLDHFKAINDTYGHSQGDEVLKRVAATLAAHCRKSDVVARWGGEEFGVLAPKTDLPGGVELADKLRSAVAATAMPEGMPQVTVSLGVAQYQPGESADTLFHRADEALYQAKPGGRDQVATDGSG